MIYSYKKNGAGDVFRKKKKNKYHEAFHRGIWMRALKDTNDVWDLPNLKEITQEEAEQLICKLQQKN